MTPAPALPLTTVPAMPGYRVTAARVVTADDPGRLGLAGSFDPRYAPPGAFGVVWLEAPTAIALHVGTAVDVAAFIAAAQDGPTELDIDPGVTYGAWPATTPWAGMHPLCSWNLNQVGIVDTLLTTRPTAAACAVVYEDLDGQAPVVRSHCLLCHGASPRHINYGGPTRWAAGWQARNHHMTSHAAGDTPAPADDCRACSRLAELRGQA
jgi:hypothetical protein